MTRKTSVLIPLFLIAFVAVGCAGDTGGSGNANKTVYVEDIDPMATALERGFMSFAAADNPQNQPLHWRVTQKESMEPANGMLFEPTNVNWTQAPAGVTSMSFRAASVPPAKIRTIDTGEYTATRLVDGTIKVTSHPSGKFGFIKSEEFNGETRTWITSSDGSPSIGDETTFPRIIEEDGRTQVLLANGEGVWVD